MGEITALPNRTEKTFLLRFNLKKALMELPAFLLESPWATLVIFMIALTRKILITFFFYKHIFRYFCNLSRSRENIKMEISPGGPSPLLLNVNRWQGVAVTLPGKGASALQ